jgi:outer membrane protein assembly factor BamB
MVTDRLLLVGSDAQPQGHLYAFDRSTGAVRWKHPFPGGVAAQVLRKGEMAYAVTLGGDLVAVEIETGRIVWKVSDPEAAGDRSLDPVLDGDRLYVGWRPGFVDAFEASTGRRIWRTRIGARLNASPSLIGSGLVIGALDGRLYRLSLGDGSMLSQIELGSIIYGALVKAGDCLLALVSADGGARLACVDPSLAKVTWSFSVGEELSTFRPLVQNARIVVGWTGKLTALDLATGAEAWSCPVPGVPRGLGGNGGVLYVGTLGGRVLALSPGRCGA